MRYDFAVTQASRSHAFSGEEKAWGIAYYYYYFTYIPIIGTKNYESKREKSNEEGTLELIQWPSGLYPFANRGLTGSWTDQLNQLINQ